MQTFAGWVSLPENRSAQTAVERIAQAVRQRKTRLPHNPLVLHGPAGTGKTHLVNALVAHVTRAVPDLAVTVLAAREFAPSGTNMPGSAHTMRTADLVIVEDLQHLPAAATEAIVQLVDQPASSSASGRCHRPAAWLSCASGLSGAASPLTPSCSPG
jgi:chromosomal replication initiation ATPase DnaA